MNSDLRGCGCRNKEGRGGKPCGEVPRLTLKGEECGFQHQFSVRESYPFHTHTFYEFFLINKGKGIHRINGSSVLLSEGSFVFVRPSDRHGYDFLNQYDLELINISFLPSIFEKICGLLGCAPSFFTDSPLCLQTELAESVLSDIREKMLHVGGLEPGAARRLYLNAVLPYFLYHFCPGPALQEVDPLPGWLSSLIRRMEEPENFIEGLPRLISLANVSQEYLNRSFRRYLHMSPTEFINMRRMDFAASLILENRMEIIDICQECGFRNLSYFYRVFQRQYGCAPGEFLRKNRPGRG